MEPSKKHIKIDNFIELISLGTIDSPDKYIINDEAVSGLASFRINLEAGSNSKCGTPTRMGALQISPIIAIVQPNRNFSTETRSYLQTGQKIPEKIILPDHEEIDEEEGKAMNLLTPNLKKLKFNQFTPTFPVKSEDNISWDDISFPKLGENYTKGNLINEGSIGFEDISNIEKDDHSGGTGTFTDLPSIIERNINKSQFEEKVVEIKVEPVSLENESKGQLEGSLLSMQLSESGCNQSVEKFDETIVFSESLYQSHGDGLSRQGIEKVVKRPLFKTLSNPNIKPLKRLSLASKFIKTESSVTPIAKGKSVKNDKRIVFRDKSVSRSRGLSQFSSCQEFKVKEKGSINTKLPKLRESIGNIKSKTYTNPYMSDWNKSALKTHFNLEMKIHKDSVGVKALVTKCVKRRVKITK